MLTLENYLSMAKVLVAASKSVMSKSASAALKAGWREVNEIIGIETSEILATASSAGTDEQLTPIVTSLRVGVPGHDLQRLLRKISDLKNEIQKIPSSERQMLIGVDLAGALDAVEIEEVEIKVQENADIIGVKIESESATGPISIGKVKIR